LGQHNNMQKIQFTGLEKQREILRVEIDANIAKVIDHGQFIMGPEVSAFEEALTHYCGATESIAVANGTDALQIAMMAASISVGDGVLVPSFTYTATAEVILVLGAIPIFVEVDPITFNIDVASLRETVLAARRTGKNPKAIIGVDLFGLPADWQAINEFAAEEGLFVLADAAQSFGGITASGHHVGTLAHVTTTSFFPAKPLGCYGDGGAIFTDDLIMADKMRSIRVHGQGKEKYETVRVGMNSRLDTLQAAVLLAKIKVFRNETTSRNKIAAAYSAALSGHVQTPAIPENVTSAWAQYTIQHADRADLQNALKERGIPTAVYYPKPMHLQFAYQGYGNGLGSLPVSERLSQEVLSLPMNPYATDEEIDCICDAVKACV
jgi:UDP-2-acetamido-2-deoxy-ribo-hexuluronate aminotransferase